MIVILSIAKNPRISFVEAMEYINGRTVLEQFLNCCSPICLSFRSEAEESAFLS
jgi:hypothetical protein